MDILHLPTAIRNPTLDKLAAGLSALPALIFVALGAVAGFWARTSPNKAMFYIVVAVGTTLVAVACETFKWISRPLLTAPRFKWLARPADAPAQCGLGVGNIQISTFPLVIQIGKPPNPSKSLAAGPRPGMPSTHQAMMTFFAFSMLLFHGRQTLWLMPLWIVLLMVNVGVGWSRIYQRCHTLPQVWAGTAVGLTLATMFYAVVPTPAPI